jgi:hypothetical protein
MDLVQSWGWVQPEGWRAQRSSTAGLQVYMVGNWQTSRSFFDHGMENISMI